MTRRQSTAPRELVLFLELFGICGIAVAQPTFDLLAKNAALFIAWRASGFEIVALALCLVFAPAMMLWAAGATIGAVFPLRRMTVHVLSVAAVLGVIALELLKSTSLGYWPLVVGAVTIAIAAAVTTNRWQAIRQWLRYLAIAPPLFAALFLAASPVTSLITASEPRASNTRIDAPARLVMIVMDEFPTMSLLDGTGMIDANLYPNFAKFAATSNWFRNNTTVAPSTEQAIPAILTGQYPKAESTLPTATEHPNSLFTLLGGSYDLNVQEAVTSICPTQLCKRTPSRLNVQSGFTGMVGDVVSIWRDFASPNRAPSFRFDGLGSADTQALDTADKFLATIRPANKPRVDFLHLLLPHFPWHYLPTGQRYEALPLHTIGLDGQDWSSDWAATMGRQRHLLQVGAADRFIGQLIDRLTAIGEFDNSMIVVTADHGVAFKAKLPFRGVAETTYPDILWTPMFVKLPQQRTGSIDDRIALSIDALPTIAATLQAKSDWKFDGINLYGPKRTDDQRKLLRWERNAIKPQGDESYLQFDGVAGFADVLRAQAAPGPNDLLRLQRVGPFAGLVGRDAQQWISPARSNATATLDQYKWFPKVDVFARRVPWNDVHGFMTAPVGTNIAISINGTVAGVFQTSLVGANGTSEYWGVLANTSFRLGANDVRLFEIVGTATRPTLHEITYGA